MHSRSENGNSGKEDRIIRVGPNPSPNPSFSSESEDIAVSESKRRSSPAPQPQIVPPGLPPTPLPNQNTLMMQFILDGCTSDDIARVFGMRRADVLRITESGLFKSGLERLRAQQEYELRAGFSGAAREAFETARGIMRDGKSEQNRLRAAQYFLEVGGFRPAPQTPAAVQNNLNMNIDIGDIVQRATEVAQRRVELVSGIGGRSEQLEQRLETQTPIPYEKIMEKLDEESEDSGGSEKEKS